MDPLRYEQMRADAQRKEDIALRENHHQAQVAQTQHLERTMVEAFTSLVDYLEGKVTKTEVVNQISSVSTPDVDKLLPALDRLNTSVVNSQIDISPIRESLDELKRSVEKIPGDMPVYEDKAIDYTDKFKGLQESVETLIKTLENKDLNVEVKAPDVNVPEVVVPAPLVHVDAPDLKPIRDLFDGLLKAVKDNKPVKPEPVDLGRLEKEQKKQTEYLRLIREKPSYMGGDVSFQDSTGKPVRAYVDDNGIITVYAKPTDAYALSNIDDSTSTEYYGYEDKDGNWYIKKLASDAFTFVKGASDYATAWSNRASQTYASYSATF